MGCTTDPSTDLASTSSLRFSNHPSPEARDSLFDHPDFSGISVIFGTGELIPAHLDLIAVYICYLASSIRYHNHDLHEFGSVVSVKSVSTTPGATGS
jgi:hypothetical protein